MKFKIIDKKSFIIYLNNSYKKIDKDNSKNIIKDIIMLIKKRYSYNFSGIYEVNIYNVKDLSTLLLFEKIDNDSFLYNSVDLKIINHKEQLNIIIDDFTLLDNKNIYNICEHYSIDEVNLHR